MKTRTASRRGDMPRYYDVRYRHETGRGLAKPTPVVKWLCRELPTGSRILDIGCGQGRETMWLAMGGHRVTAVDFSPVGIGNLRGLAQRYDVDSLIESSCRDVRDGIPNEQFAGVVVTLLLQHLTTAEAATLLKRARKLTLPGGVIAVTIYSNADGELNQRYPGHCVPVGPGQALDLFASAGGAITANWTSSVEGVELFTMIWQNSLS